MNLRSALLYMLFMPLALTAYAQIAIDSRANHDSQNSTLPLRNLQIEVRQISVDEAAGATRRASGQVQPRPGQSSAQWEASAQDGERSREASAQQQVLVLNGRRVSIGLRNSTPFRLVQTFVVNGVMTVVPGTVLIEAGTGFDATARWDGDDQVALALTASQGQGRYQTQTASTSTLVVVPLNEWVTVAQSDLDSSGSGSSTGGQTQWRHRTTTEVQVRVNVR